MKGLEMSIIFNFKEKTKQTEINELKVMLERHIGNIIAWSDFINSTETTNYKDIE